MLRQAGRATRPYKPDWSLLLRTNLYRVWLIAATTGLTLLLYRLQNLLGAVPPHPTSIQVAVQWAELIWLVPVPLSLALWLGWLVFAEVSRPNRAPTGVPWTKTGTPVTVVIRIVTRGDNLPVLRETVSAVHRSFAGYLPQPGPYRIEVVSDQALHLDNDQGGLTRVVVVPPDYQTSAGSLYKARALTYLQSQITPKSADWLLYLDEESKLDTSVIAGIYRFIGCTGTPRRRTGRVIGQGAILYQGGHWFFRGADGLRTADDLGRFRLQYALGMPLFGVHGSYILVRGQDDRRLSFDVGPHNSLTEDAAWALRAWALGYRFGWIEGYLHEQPPQHIMDFMRQRARWLSGIRLVVTDRCVPLRYRACLGIFTLLWQLAFLPFVVAVAAVVVHIAPFAWMRLPADFAWAAFVLAYLQGAHVQVRHPAAIPTGLSVIAKRPSTERLPGRLYYQWRQAIALAGSWAMTLCYFWFALLEALGVLYSLKPTRGFFVIRKPSLAKTARLGGPQLQAQPRSVVPRAPLEPSG